MSEIPADWQLNGLIWPPLRTSRKHRLPILSSDVLLGVALRIACCFSSALSAALPGRGAHSPAKPTGWCHLGVSSIGGLAPNCDENLPPLLQGSQIKCLETKFGTGDGASAVNLPCDQAVLWPGAVGSCLPPAWASA